MSNDFVPNGAIATIGTGTVAEAVDRLLAAVEAHEKISLVTKVDHQAAASKVGLELDPIVLIIVGNPALGSLLMQAAPSVAIDLPMKILIRQMGDGVQVLHNDPAYLAKRHQINEDLPQLAVGSGALQSLANVAAGI